MKSTGDVVQDFENIWPKAHANLRELGLDCSKSAAGFFFGVGFGAGKAAAQQEAAAGPERR